ncbi:MAG: hypothetical protein EB127_26015 [Alphaproteobacteria bacterium]|nr:hypothetical protein [Alphaproteobacteria bacterium]
MEQELQRLQALRVHKASSLPNIQEDTSLSRRDSAAVDKLLQSAKEKKKDEKYSRLRQMSSQRKYNKSREKLIDELYLQLDSLKQTINSLHAKLNAPSTQSTTPIQVGLSRYTMTSIYSRPEKNPRSGLVKPRSGLAGTSKN